MKYCSSCGETLIRKIPGDDNRERWVCDHCNTVHYQNPIIVVGCVAEKNGKILLCKRAIEPRHGYWTVPAGFMELGESLADGAARETLEEACADIEIGHLFASVDVIHAGQVHLFFTGTLAGGYGVGEESLETSLFSEDESPWEDLAFPCGRFALKKYFEDQAFFAPTPLLSSAVLPRKTAKYCCASAQSNLAMATGPYRQALWN